MGPPVPLGPLVGELELDAISEADRLRAPLVLAERAVVQQAVGSRREAQVFEEALNAFAEWLRDVADGQGVTPLVAAGDDDVHRRLEEQGDARESLSSDETTIYFGEHIKV